MSNAETYLVTSSLKQNSQVDDWLAVHADGRVTVRTGKVDIGQRVSTAIALIAAEELDLDPSHIEMARPDTDAAPDEGFTSGSNSMEHSGQAVRLAAATARRYMLQRAAEMLAVDAQSLEVSDGLIRSREANRSVTYGELMGGLSFDIAVDPEVTVKVPTEHRLLGKAARAIGLEALVTGRTRFVHDMVIPGMLHARVVRPPHYHARLRHLQESIAERLEGARVVRDGSFLAVAANDEYAAIKAASRVAAAAQWTSERGLECGDTYARLVNATRESLPVIDGVPRDTPVPAPEPPPDAARTTLGARFERPYQMHASIGPSAALAHFDNDQLTVWTHSQGIYPLREAIADLFEMNARAVRVIHTPGAGCYGHNGADDAALDAALVARALPGAPILLKWSREDEHAWEPYAPCMVVDIRASLDHAGRVIDWSHESYSDTHRGRPRGGRARSGASSLLAARYLADPLEPVVAEPNTEPHGGIHRNADPLYVFPRRRIVKHLVRAMPLRTSAMRTLGAFANTFACESFIDELAAAADIDPLEFRLRHLEDQRAKDVLDAAARRFGWREAPRAASVGQGLAFARYKNSKAYAAVAIEVEVDDDAVVHLCRAVIAADAGQIIDRDGLSAQLEGGLLQAASWTLYERVTFDKDGITSRDWESYPILTFDNVPAAMETVLIERPGQPFLGAGEATAGPTAGAIANAIFDATGLRLRRLPFTPEAVRAAALRG